MSANERIQWFHKKVADKCYPNASHLSERFGISHRQAQRDIDFIKRKLDAPIEYEKSKKGYYYVGHFLLPLSLTDENDSEINDVIAGLRDFNDRNSARSVVQMQLPYTAELEIRDRLTVMSLRSFITTEKGRGRYVCEFPSVELFLGVIMSMDADIKILSPDWLRERLVQFAERILTNNSDRVNE